MTKVIKLFLFPSKRYIYIYIQPRNLKAEDLTVVKFRPKNFVWREKVSFQSARVSVPELSIKPPSNSSSVRNFNSSKSCSIHFTVQLFEGYFKYIE